ncbi:hypothetical protein M8J77_023254 [Diaphorina citri]|nr:hypothetical protein M8J77_023254 [Diaphorina citri]
MQMPKFRFEEYSLKEITSFKKKFNNFIIAHELDEKPEKVKVAYLKLCMDEDTNEILDGTNEENVAALWKYLEEQVIPKNTTCFEQYKFFNRSQEENESFIKFYQDLKTVARNCEFGNQLDTIMKVRIVFGIKDNQVRERLLRNPNLTLQQVVDHCKGAEEAKKKNESIKEKSDPEDVAMLSQKPKFVPKYEYNQPKLNSQQYIQHNRNIGRKYGPRNCTRCGRVHPRNQCPAYNKICSICHGRNHFASSCFKKRNLKRNNRVRALSCSSSSDESSSNEPGNLFIIHTLGNNSKSTSWYQNFEFKRGDINFKLDTGADISVLPLKYLNQINPKLKNKLTKTSIIVKAFGGGNIKILGYTTVKLSNKDKVVDVKFYITPTDHGMVPILGAKDCEALGLIQRIKSLSKIPTEKELIEANKDIFQGIGKIKDVDYKIKIKKVDNPVVRPPRRVPESIKDKLKSTLDSMVKDEIIQKVDAPKSWCSNMVIVEKPNGDLRICIDPVDLNANLIREYHLVPKVSEIKVQLTGKKVFSVLDLKQGFYQIPLHPESTDICTFSTPFGYYKYLRCPFGISTIPEVFLKVTQRKNINTLISNRLVKMRLAMLQYDLDVTYLPGRQMVIADLLSRNYLEETYENEIEIKGFVHDLATVNLLSLDQDTILKMVSQASGIQDSGIRQSVTSDSQCQAQVRGEQTSNQTLHIFISSPFPRSQPFSTKEFFIACKGEFDTIVFK